MNEFAKKQSVEANGSAPSIFCYTLDMDEAIKKQIQQSLRNVISTETVTILLAIESGSRAWGFASQDSDYDVRFIYVRPINNYLRLQPVRDVIELPIVDELDINGWDLKKAIGLLLKSNPPILEWLQSPIVYMQNTAFKPLQAAALQFFDPVRTSHHYLSMALKNQKYLQHDLVMRKKYLYVLRPLLCLEWITTQNTIPPMEFSKLLEFTFSNTPDHELKNAVDNLLASKMAGKEVDKQPRDKVLDQFITKRLNLHQSAKFGKSKNPDYALADALFLETLTTLNK